MKLLIATAMVTIIAWPSVKRIATPCPCESQAYSQMDGTDTIFLHSYRILGVKKKDAETIAQCLALKTQQPISMDSAFMRSLCSCSTKRLCFDQAKIVRIAKELQKHPDEVILQLEYQAR
ncbi:MAG: hypothetical protein IT229_01965 [Flavobacteriales bacterium]|nr:hypothetical protein [Flavobacteriales bacterium]